MTGDAQCLGKMEEVARTVDVETGDFLGTGSPNTFGRQGVYVPQTWMAEID